MEDDISGGVDGGRNDILEEELERWTQNYIDVNRLVAFHISTYNVVFIYRYKTNYAILNISSYLLVITVWSKSWLTQNVTNEK